MARIIFPALLFLILVEVTFAQSSFIPQNLGANVNSPYDEIHPVISPDRKILYFTRVDHPENKHGKRSADVWYSEWRPQGWSPAQPMPSVNTGRHTVVLSITADGKQLLLNNESGLSITENNGSGWSTPMPIGIKASKDATLSADGKYLYWSKGSKLYRAERTANKWSAPQPLSGLDGGKMVSPHLTNNDRTLYFARRTKGRQLDFYKIERKDVGSQSWTAPQALSDTINTSLSENDLRTTPNGAWGYFSSTTNATGKADIFMVKLYEDNPFVLVKGAVVNAVTKRPLRNKNIAILVDGQNAPFFTVNKDSATFTVRLPFGKSYTVSAMVDHYTPKSYSVDATLDHEFRTVLLDLEEEPLPYVLVKGKLMVKNTDKVIPPSAKPKIVVDGEEVDSAYIDPAHGIYSIKLNHGTLYYVQVSAKRFESFPEVVDLNAIDGYEEITLDLQADAEKMAIVRGTIIDKKTSKPLTTIVPQVQVEGVASVAVSVDTLSGAYELRLPLHEKHTISAAVPGYYPIYETIDVTNESREVQFSKDLVVVPLERGQSVRLNNIFFEPGKTVMNEASYPELDRLVAFLQNNPKIKIEIGGHTDKSSKISTLTMAKVVSNYLTSKGIAKNRITARGYAATKPVASNKTPEQKALNRRIEFTIIEK